jgi:hypothetical protein
MSRITDDTLGSKLDAFFDKAAAAIESYTKNGDLSSFPALAREWSGVCGRPAEVTQFSDLVTLASKAFELAGARPDAEDFFVDLSLCSWKAVTVDARFPGASPASRAVTWNNLAQCMLRKFAREKDASWLDSAIESQRRAIEALADEVPNRADYYAGLSSLHWDRYVARRDEADLAESVALLDRWAGSLTPASRLLLTALQLQAAAACRTKRAEYVDAAAQRLRDSLASRAIEALDQQRLLIQLAACLQERARLSPSTDVCERVLIELSDILSEYRLREEVSEFAEDASAGVTAISRLALLQAGTLPTAVHSAAYARWLDQHQQRPLDQTQTASH